MDINNPIILKICDVEWYVLKELAGIKYIVVSKDVLFKGYYALTPPPTFNDSKLYNFLNKKFVSNFDDWDIDRTKISPITVPTLGQYNMYIRDKLPPCTLSYLLSTPYQDKLDTLLAVTPTGDLISVYMTEQCGIRPCFIIEKEYAQQFIVSAQTPVQIENESKLPDEREIAKIIENAEKSVSHQSTDPDKDIEISEQIIIDEEVGIADAVDDEPDEMPDINIPEADDETYNDDSAEQEIGQQSPVMILAHPHSGTLQTEKNQPAAMRSDADKAEDTVQTAPNADIEAADEIELTADDPCTESSKNERANEPEDDISDEESIPDTDTPDVRNAAIVDEADSCPDAPTVENIVRTVDREEETPIAMPDAPSDNHEDDAGDDNEIEDGRTDSVTNVVSAPEVDEEPATNGFSDEADDEVSDTAEEGSGEQLFNAADEATEPSETITEQSESSAPDTENNGVFDDEIDDEMPCTVDTHETETVESIPTDISDDLFAGATTEAGHFYNADYDDDKDTSGLLEDSPVERDFASVELDKELNEDTASDITISFASPQPVVYMYSDEFKDYGLVIRNQAQLDEILRQHGLVVQMYNSVGRIERKPVSKSSITDRIMSVQKRWNHKK